MSAKKLEAGLLYTFGADQQLGITPNVCLLSVYLI